MSCSSGREEIGSGAHARPGCGTTHHKMTGGHQLARMLAAETGGALSSATSAAAWAAAAAAARTHQVRAVTTTGGRGPPWNGVAGLPFSLDISWHAGSGLAVPGSSEKEE